MNRDHRTITNISTFLSRFYSLYANIYYAYDSKRFPPSFIITISFFNVFAFPFAYRLYPLKQSNTHAQHTFYFTKFCLALNAP